MSGAQNLQLKSLKNNLVKKKSLKVLLKNSSENLAQVTENSIKGIMNKWFSLFFLKSSWFYLYLKKCLLIKITKL